MRTNPAPKWWREDGEMLRRRLCGIFAVERHCAMMTKQKQVPQQRNLASRSALLAAPRNQSGVFMFAQ